MVSLKTFPTFERWLREEEEERSEEDARNGVGEEVISARLRPERIRRLPHRLEDYFTKLTSDDDITGRCAGEYG